MPCLSYKILTRLWMRLPPHSHFYLPPSIGRETQAYLQLLANISKQVLLPIILIPWVYPFIHPIVISINSAHMNKTMFKIQDERKAGFPRGLKAQTHMHVPHELHCVYSSGFATATVLSYCNNCWEQLSSPSLTPLIKHMLSACPQQIIPCWWMLSLNKLSIPHSQSQFQKF